MMDLKPCPFCTGRVAMMPPEREGDGWFACCENHDTCPTPCILCPTRELAVEAWNTRPREDALTEEVERLKLALMGGEDVAGYAASRPAAEIIASHKQHERDLRAYYESLDAEVEALRAALTGAIVARAALKGKDQ